MNRAEPEGKFQGLPSPVLPGDRGKRLRRLVRDLLVHPRSRRSCSAPFRLVARPSGVRASPTDALAAPTLEQAERELATVHRLELAWLLREAARHRIAALSSRETDEAALLPLESLRASLREELEAARTDGMALAELAPGARLARQVESCCEGAPQDWCSARELALASLELHEDPHGRLCLAEALLAEGAPRAAADEFRRCLQRNPPPSLLPRLAAGHARARKLASPP